MAGEFKTVDLGLAPIAAIKQTLGLEIDPLPVRFSVAAQKHAYKRHKNDFPVIEPHLKRLVSSPMYIGDDLKNPGKIELVGRIPRVDGAALVAITIEHSADERYHVCSCYLISQSELDKKKASQILKAVKL